MFTFWTVSSDAVRTTQPTGDEYQSHGGASRRGRSTLLKTINLIIQKGFVEKNKNTYRSQGKICFSSPEIFSATPVWDCVSDSNLELVCTLSQK